MKLKKDKKYCGVREWKIKTAKPILNEKVIREWFFHQKERTKIFYKKEVLKELSPWTEDEILKKYKFVNTKRKWDRESRWLLENISENKKLSYENKILNSFLFRVINKGKTFEIFNGPLDFSKLEKEDLEDIKNNLIKFEKYNPNYVFFSAAYILGGPKKNFGDWLKNEKNENEENMVMRMIKFVSYNKEKILKGIKEAQNQKEVYESLKSFLGIGKFLAYQIFVDLTYIEEFPFTENNFVICGPGCDRGVNWIFKDKDGLTNEECLFWFVENIDKIAKKYKLYWNEDEVFHFLPRSERFYSLMDMENSGACEIDKRCCTLFAGKRLKQKYKKNN